MKTISKINDFTISIIENVFEKNVEIIYELKKNLKV